MPNAALYFCKKAWEASFCSGEVAQFGARIERRTECSEGIKISQWTLRVSCWIFWDQLLHALDQLLIHGSKKKDEVSNEPYPIPNLEAVNIRWSYMIIYYIMIIQEICKHILWFLCPTFHIQPHFDYLFGCRHPWVPEPGNIRVYCRVRPMTEAELGASQKWQRNWETHHETCPFVQSYWFLSEVDPKGCVIDIIKTNWLFWMVLEAIFWGSDENELQNTSSGQEVDVQDQIKVGKIAYHLSNEKNLRCLGYIGDSTARLCENYNKPV